MTVTAGTGWGYEFKDLPKYANGKEIVYTITEDKVEGYTATIDGFNITNTHKPETITVKGKKTWDDKENQDGIRPEAVTVRLQADGKEVEHVTVTAGTGWGYEFKDLPKYANGKEIVYTITEDKVEGYTATIDGFNITNTHKPKKLVPEEPKEPKKPEGVERHKNPEKPNNSTITRSGSPQTGDNTDIFLWIAAFSISFIVIVWLIYYAIKKRNKK